MDQWCSKSIIEEDKESSSVLSLTKLLQSPVYLHV